MICLVQQEQHKVTAEMLINRGGRKQIGSALASGSESLLIELGSFRAHVYYSPTRVLPWLLGLIPNLDGGR